jgi:chemotaxis signal transduction protein
MSAALRTNRDTRTMATAASLRLSFDAGFALPPTASSESLDALLAIRIGAVPYALRLEDIGGLHAGLHVTPVPSPNGSLLGIVALRGTMAPVYDLGALLGYPPCTDSRWCALAPKPHLVGFAFAVFEAHVRIARTPAAIEDSAARADSVARHVRGTVQACDALRAIIDIPSLLKSLQEKPHDR